MPQSIPCIDQLFCSAAAQPYEIFSNSRSESCSRSLQPILIQSLFVCLWDMRQTANPNQQKAAASRSVNG